MIHMQTSNALSITVVLGSPSLQYPAAIGGLIRSSVPYYGVRYDAWRVDAAPWGANTARSQSSPAEGGSARALWGHCSSRPWSRVSQCPKLPQKVVSQAGLIQL